MQYTNAIKAAMEGKDEGFSFLYNQTYKDKYYIALKYMGNDTDAQDVLQEAYARAFRKLDSLQEHEKFPQWLGMIVANTAKNALQKKKPLTFSDLTPENDEGEEITLEIEDEQTDYQPETVYTQKETQELVREMIGALSDEQRMCILMFYMENQSIKEIAETLGCSENTIKSRLHSGRKALKNRVDDLENRGYKLRGVAPLPFLLGNMEMEKDAMDFAHVADIMASSLQMGSTAAGQAADQTTAHAATQGFIHTTMGKIAIGVVAAGLLGGGAFGIYNMMQPEPETSQEQAKEETTVQESESAPQAQENTAEPEVDLAAVYGAYESVLADNESRIKSYYTLNDRPLALCDINGDEVPELFFFTGDDYKLNIYTYMDGTAKEIEYTFTKNSNNGEANAGDAFVDVNAASGTRYVIYKSVTENRFIIYSSIEDMSQSYYVNEYEMSEDGTINEVERLHNWYHGINADYSYEEDLFWKDGTEIPAEEFSVEFKDALDSIDQVLIYNGQDDTTIWGRFNGEAALSMSYDEMMGVLKQ